MNKINASESFKAETAEMLVSHQANKKKIRFIPIAAVAASLALVVALGAIFFPISKDNKSFVITANAAELNNNSFTTIGELPASGWWTKMNFSEGASEHGLDVGTGITNGTRSDFMLNVEGKNIEKITFSIENGAIAVPDKNKKLLSSKKAPDIDYALQNKDRTLYSEITTSYDNQINPINDNVDIVFYTYENDDELRKIVKDFVEIEEKTPWVGEINPDKAKECTQKFFEAVIDNCKLEVKVVYNDGTTQTRRVALKTDIEVKTEHVCYSDEEEHETEGDMYSVTVNLKAKLV